MNGKQSLAVVSLVIVVSFLLLWEVHTLTSWYRGVHPSTTKSLTQIPDGEVPERVFLTRIKQNTDKEWIPVLREGNIISVKPLKGEVNGLAEKWKVQFENGHVAMVKPVQAWSPLDISWPYINYTNHRAEGARVRRADRKNQGYNEIVAYYLDRVLGFNRKPPIVGRYLSSKLLFSYALELPEPLSLNDRLTQLKYYFPEQDIPVSMHAWMEGLITTAPKFDVQDYLAFYDQPKFSKDQKKHAADVSDTMIFDFLIDDHDREKEHNWMSDTYKNLLIWDSGLAFSHGPYGRDSCLDLLCGPSQWNERSKYEFGLEKCTRICRFRNSTIFQLESMSRYRARNAPSLGTRLQQALQQDNLAPVIQYNLYYLWGRWPKVRFMEENFYLGLDAKLERFWKHYDQCVLKHGQDAVLIPY